MEQQPENVFLRGASQQESRNDSSYLIHDSHNSQNPRHSNLMLKKNQQTMEEIDHVTLQPISSSTHSNGNNNLNHHP
jgi:hypothetical protein